MRTNLDAAQESQRSFPAEEECYMSPRKKTTASKGRLERCNVFTVFWFFSYKIEHEVFLVKEN